MSTVTIKKEIIGASYQKDSGAKYSLFKSPDSLFADGTKIVMTVGNMDLGFSSTDTVTIGGVSYTGQSATIMCDAIRDTVFLSAGGSASTTVQVLTDAATTVWDWSKGRIAKWAIQGNRTISITGASAGQVGVLYIAQDSVGTRIPTYPAGSRFPSGYALSTAANAIDELEVTYDGTNYFWTASNKAFSGGLLMPFLADLLFPTQVGLSNSSGTWSGTIGTAYDNYGLSNLSLAASADGYIQCQYAASDAANAIIAFNTSNVNEKYPNYEAGIYTNGGAIWRVDAGTAATTGVSITIGDYIRVVRSGTIIKGQKSTDAGVTWTDVYTYSTATAAQLFVNMDINIPGRVYNPKIYNGS